MLQEKNSTEQGSIIYASISNGSIITRSNASDEKATKRVTKTGNTVFEREWSSIYGIITAMEWVENRFNENEIRVRLQDGENTALLTIKVDSSYGRGFLAQIFNVDFTKGIQFSPWQRENDLGKKSMLYLNYTRQEKVEYKLPAGCPELEFAEIKGKKVLNSLTQAKQQEFLEKAFNDLVVAKGLQMPDNLSGKPLSTEEKSQLSATPSKFKKHSKDTTTSEDFFDID